MAHGELGIAKIAWKPVCSSGEARPAADLVVLRRRGGMGVYGGAATAHAIAARAWRAIRAEMGRGDAAQNFKMLQVVGMRGHDNDAGDASGIRRSFDTASMGAATRFRGAIGAIMSRWPTAAAGEFQGLDSDSGAAAGHALRRITTAASAPGLVAGVSSVSCTLRPSACLESARIRCFDLVALSEPDLRRFTARCPIEQGFVRQWRSRAGGDGRSGPCRGSTWRRQRRTTGSRSRRRRRNHDRAARAAH